MTSLDAMGSRTRLHLVLPHQLFEQNFEAPAQTRFVLIEHDLLFRQYRFHAQKLVLHRASMARFARRLRGRGFEVDVLASDADHSSDEQLTALVRELEPERVTCFDVVDDWLGRDLTRALSQGGYRLTADDVFESPNFLTSRDEIGDWFGDNRARMHDFYVWQRRRLGILIENDGEPVGGQWSFDADNRKKLPRDYEPAEALRFAPENTDVQAAIAWVEAEFPEAPGDPREFAWPTSAEEARAGLDDFLQHRLEDFGPYEDAISAEHGFINHGLLTAALNIGLLDPREVVEAVVEAAEEQDTPIASLEGFVRQVIGWREYMRATYRLYGRRMRTTNHLDHTRSLTDGWWAGTTGLDPVDLVIGRVLETGYAHHIERLMVLGNAMSLLRIDPDAVYAWFMEMFIDAYDWVMVPNVYAMSQFASGEAITTKPYVSGSNYLRKMSDLGTGDWTDEWDALYWTFVHDHRDVFEANHRSKMMPRMLDRMDGRKREGHLRRAAKWLD